MFDGLSDEKLLGGLIVLVLTKEMFEASKIVAPAIARGRASLFFDYGVRRHATIRGTSQAGKSPCIIFKMEKEFRKITNQYGLAEYMALEWEEIKALLRFLDDEPVWIELKQPI